MKDKTTTIYPQNTIDDFKRTARNRQSLICPSCGAPLSFHNPNGVSFHLTPCVTSHLNDRLSELRMFTGGLELYLRNLRDHLKLLEGLKTPYLREEWDYIQRIFVKPDGQTNKGENASLVPIVNEEWVTTPKLDTNAIYQQIEEEEKKDPISSYFNASGEFKQKIVASRWAKFFRLEIDTHDFIRNFKILPLLPEKSADGAWQENDDDNIRCEIYSKMLLGVGLERRVNGLLYELIMEQDPFRHLITKSWLEKNDKLIRACVATFTGRLAEHYDYLEYQLSKEDNWCENDEEKANGIQENIRRARLLLLILHGHAYQQLSETEQQSIQADPDFIRVFLTDIYALPSEPLVREKLLTQLVNSRVLLQRQRGNMAWLPKFVPELLMFFETWIKRFKKGSDSYYWLDYLDTLVRVRCANPVIIEKYEETSNGDTGDGRQGEINKGLATEQTTAQNNTVEVTHDTEKGTEKNQEKFIFSAHMAQNWYGGESKRLRGKKRRVQSNCGWSPSIAPTYSMIVLGSPGTGKTTLLQSGLSKLMLCKGSVGLNIEHEDAHSMEVLKEINRGFLVGALSDPTKVNLAINLSVNLIKNNDLQNRFAVVDLPGEHVSSLASGEGSDADLRRMIQHANTIIFQFDFWSDPELIRYFVDLPMEHFSEQLEASHRIHASRADSQGYLGVDQQELLLKLIAMLKQERGKESFKDINFVCVFPKIDTLVARYETKNSEHFVFTPLMKKLSDAHILIQGYKREQARRDRRGEHFADMHTMAGAGIDWNNDTIKQFLKGNSEESEDSNSKGNIEDQIRLCRRISDLTKECIFDFGQILSEAPDGMKAACRDRIKKSVVEEIEKSFPNAYFLPVSALGTIPTEQQGEQKELGYTPNSILSEYVFLLPILLALKAVSVPKNES